jgi:hypothetical protein
MTTTPLIGADVQAKSSGGGYQSRYNHGVCDATATHMYILQPGKGFQFHSHEFINGYVDGFCSIAGSGASSDADEATFDCDRGFSSAAWVGN